MLRSLFSGISGLRAHQTMLDVTGNNIANVNTTAFKASAVQFQDTLSQLTQAAGGPQDQVGGTNPAQIGLGVQVAGISTNFAQGSAQSTGRAKDLMISGDGFFITKMGDETLYTRAGALDFDPLGRLVAPGGALVQGWAADANGVINAGGPVGTITLPLNAVLPATATTDATVGGNLPSDAANGTVLVREVTVYDASGTGRPLSLTYTSTGPGAWNVAATHNGTTVNGNVAFTNGQLTAGGTMVVNGITVDMTSLTGFAKLTTVSVTDQNGSDAGTLQSFTIGKDGTVIGLFNNGGEQAVGRIALATFVNPGGLEKAGGSGYRATFNSGAAEVGVPGQGGAGALTAGQLEMSNVDLSQEFTNLIVAQRGFQANARIITTSDEVLQELTNLKR
jgi:flagellar hook protein FlgE